MASHNLLSSEDSVKCEETSEVAMEEETMPEINESYIFQKNMAMDLPMTNLKLVKENGYDQNRDPNRRVDSR